VGSETCSSTWPPRRRRRAPLTAEGAPAEARGGPQRIPRPIDAQPGNPAPWADLPEAARRPTADDVRRVFSTIGPAEPSPVEREGFAQLPDMFRPALPDRPPRASAVIAPIYEHAGQAWVVLTRRAAHLRSHSGEVSFPGGGIEPGDADLRETALREAWEETALDPASVEIVGELDHLSTITSGSFIVPYVGLLPGRPDLEPSAAEVDAVLHVPLAELLLPEVFREELWDFGGQLQRPIVFFDLVGDTIWGATASMLRQLLGLVTGTVGRGELDHD
jgi:8-oxo-dGTP pyrophosphatase MutT (NUDIX family)